MTDKEIISVDESFVFLFNFSLTGLGLICSIPQYLEISRFNCRVHWFGTIIGLILRLYIIDGHGLVGLVQEEQSVVCYLKQTSFVGDEIFHVSLNLGIFHEIEDDLVLITIRVLHDDDLRILLKVNVFLSDVFFVEDCSVVTAVHLLSLDSFEGFLI